MTRENRPGEAAERAIQRRKLTLFAVCGIGGLITGLLLAGTTDFDSGPAAGQLPMWAAAILTVLWVGMMGYGAWYYETKVDEVERNANYYGYAVGGGLLLFVYPVWCVLWWAGAVPEPMHEALMGLLLAGALGGFLWKKYR